MIRGALARKATSSAGKKEGTLTLRGLWKKEKGGRVRKGIEVEG